MDFLKNNLVIIHGAGPSHYRSLKDGSGDWQSQLANNLKTSFKVIAPQMPTPKNPSYEEWKTLLDKNLAKLKGEIIFVGHSLGGSFLVKYLSESSLTQKVAGLFLVSSPFNTILGFEVPKNFSALSQIKTIILYHSLDDVEVPFAHALIYKDLLKARLRTFNDRGHYFKKTPFPEIVEDISDHSSGLAPKANYASTVR